jgi:hypothetical protein
MPFKWTLVLLLVLVLSSIVIGIIDTKSGSGGTDPVSTVVALTTTTTGEMKNPLGILASFVTDSADWLKALYGMVFFDFTILNTGYWVTVRMLFWLIGIVWFILFVLALRGTASS